MICRVRAIIRRGNELFLVRQRGRDGVPKDFWALPGGHVDDGEMLVDALKRELIEETGFEPVVGRLLFVHQFQSGQAFDGPEFFFFVENPDDFRDIDLTATSHGAHELVEAGFYEPHTLSAIRPEFLADISRLTANAPTEFIVRTKDQS